MLESWRARKPLRGVLFAEKRRDIISDFQWLHGEVIVTVINSEVCGAAENAVPHLYVNLGFGELVITQTLITLQTSVVRPFRSPTQLCKKSIPWNFPETGRRGRRPLHFGFKFYCRKIASLGVFSALHWLFSLFGCAIPHSSLNTAPLFALFTIICYNKNNCDKT